MAFEGLSQSTPSHGQLFASIRRETTGRKAPYLGAGLKNASGKKREGTPSLFRHFGVIFWPALHARLGPEFPLYHSPSNLSRGNVAQKQKVIFPVICAFCLLQSGYRYAIMIIVNEREVTSMNKFYEAFKEMHQNGMTAEQSFRWAKMMRACDYNPFAD